MPVENVVYVLRNNLRLSARGIIVREEAKKKPPQKQTKKPQPQKPKKKVRVMLSLNCHY